MNNNRKYFIKLISNTRRFSDNLIKRQIQHLLRCKVELRLCFSDCLFCLLESEVPSSIYSRRWNQAYTGVGLSIHVNTSSSSLDQTTTNQQLRCSSIVLPCMVQSGGWLGVHGGQVTYKGGSANHPLTLGPYIFLWLLSLVKFNQSYLQ